MSKNNVIQDIKEAKNEVQDLTKELLSTIENNTLNENHRINIQCSEEKIISVLNYLESLCLKHKIGLENF